MHHSTSTGLLSGGALGLRMGVLPCIVADAEPDLVRCLPPRTDHGREMWLLTHERVRHTPRVRVVDRFPLRTADAARPRSWKRSAPPPLRRRPAAPVGHRPLADRDLDRGGREQPRRIEDRQRRNLLRDQQRDFGADQRHRVAAICRQLVDDPDIGIARFVA